MTVRLPEDLYQWLRQTAFDEHRSQAAIIVTALSDYKDKHTWEQQ